ncbi:MAG TPA: flagellar hook basal-body protein [Longimicrobiales bacterium]
MNTEPLRRAAQALYYWERRQEVLANNLANAETDGFKGMRVFGRLVQDALLAPETATDFRQGTLTPTGGPLDLAIEGDGFFVVQTPAGERLSRGGALRLDEAGRLVDGAGRPLLGEDGPIVVPPGTVQIDAGGTVRVDGTEVGRLRVERLPEGAEPQRDAGTLFVPGPVRVPVPEGERHVRQGFVERSNVDPLDSLVEMITVQRSYAAIERGIRVMDGVLERIANDIGRVS